MPAERGWGMGATEAGWVDRDSQRRGVRPVPRCWYRFDDAGQGDGQALRPDKAGMSGWKARGM
jgi:hypothetical protein